MEIDLVAQFWQWLKKDYLKFLGAFCLVLAVFGLTRFFNLNRLPIFCDEAIYLRWAQIANNDASFRFISLTDGKQPMQTWLTLPLLRLIEDPLIAGRVLSAMAGFSLLLVGILVAFSFFKDKKNIYFLMFLMAFCPYLIFFDRMALAESLLTLFAFGAFLFSFLLAKNPRLDIALLAGLWIGAGFLVKSQMLIFLLLFPLGAIFIFQKEGFKLSKPLAKYLLFFLMIIIMVFLIYNIQRLSPWMYRIQQKNSDFVVPLSEALANLKRFGYNFYLSIQWFWSYLTPPVFIVSLLGLILLTKNNFWQGLYLSAWIFVPALGEAFIARFFTSRYLSFLTPFFLLSAAYFFVKIYQVLTAIIGKKKIVFFLLLFLIWPIYNINLLLTNPEDFPFTSTDKDYIEGWTAGYGVKETADYLKQIARKEKVVVGTEGTFGLLSQGLEIYLMGEENITVKGYYPLPSLPPQELQEAVQAGKKVYFLVNNTPGDFAKEKFVLKKEYAKAHNQGSLRFYEILAEK